jgi:hypothetical protein
MGKDKTTTNTDMRSTSENTQKASATAQEDELNRLNMEAIKAAQAGLTGVQGSGLDLAQSLLTGGNLPGYLGSLPVGISPELTQEIARKAVGDIQPTFQGLGILDSGVNASISARTSGDVRQRSAEFNVNNLSNLLNMALAGQGQVQAPILGQNAQLNESLAGLRTLSGTGLNTNSGTVTSQAMNPFLKSFQTSFGQGLGTSASAGLFGSGGGASGSGSDGKSAAGASVLMKLLPLLAGGTCLPDTTLIEMPDGSLTPITEIQVGDEVKGGEVLAKIERARMPGHTFYLHDTSQGEVVMSDTHPTDAVVYHKAPIEHSSKCTHDILTESGWYVVNGVVLRSTITSNMLVAGEA